MLRLSAVFAVVVLLEVSAGQQGPPRGGPPGGGPPGGGPPGGGGGGGGPGDGGPPSEEDKISSGQRIVTSSDQRPCANKEEDCIQFADQGECDENPRWMNQNCEKACSK